ncbi:unnamed protein product, partial [Mesorhabditis belari]|uniref:Uncharacterized protein n=1 Tax=Mesorhabditis belari TaxID=2138241 RepID=A0AAF3F2J2_9BILA
MKNERECCCQISQNLHCTTCKICPYLWTCSCEESNVSGVACIHCHAVYSFGATVLDPNIEMEGYSLNETPVEMLSISNNHVPVFDECVFKAMIGQSKCKTKAEALIFELRNSRGDEMFYTELEQIMDSALEKIKSNKRTQKPAILPMVDSKALEEKKKMAQMRASVMVKQWLCLGQQVEVRKWKDRERVTGPLQSM